MALKYLVIPFITAVLSQSIKVIIEFIRNKKMNFRRFVTGMGGMPSTHSALVTSMCTLIYLDNGISPFFAITLFFSLIVIYDSMGIRYESGEQAKIINRVTGSHLNEQIGHKRIETLMGVILGISFTLLMSIIIK